MSVYNNVIENNYVIYTSAFPVQGVEEVEEDVEDLDTDCGSVGADDLVFTDEEWSQMPTEEREVYKQLAEVGNRNLVIQRSNGKRCLVDE